MPGSPSDFRRELYGSAGACLAKVKPEDLFRNRPVVRRTMSLADHLSPTTPQQFHQEGHGRGQPLPQLDAPAQASAPAEGREASGQWQGARFGRGALVRGCEVGDIEEGLITEIVGGADAKSKGLPLGNQHESNC